MSKSNNKIWPADLETMKNDKENQIPYQAYADDYKNTGFDKGHLNPASYHCDNARLATYTLTNAVPQDPCFNQQVWKLMEQKGRELMRKSCNFAGAKRFFITGSISKDERMIPIPEKDEESNIERPTHRVRIPSHMWTAACCDSSETTNPASRNEGFSFAYISANTPFLGANAVGVDALEQQLAKLYPTSKSPKIFDGGCFEGSSKSVSALTEMERVIKDAIQNIYSMVPFMKPESLPPKKRPKTEPTQLSAA